jgi:VWFA-related protein
VNTAALDLVRSSNPQDEVFVVNFNDERYLDQDFTNKISLLKEALEKIDARGGTALYDALEGAAEHLKLHARLDKRVILVVTDGEDTASRESLEQAVRYLQQENSPQIFAIGLLQDDREGKRAKKALSLLAEHTGGQAFFPKDLSEVDAITQQVARDIRNQYTVGYKPSRAKSAGGYRQVRLEARAKGMSKLQVRTRTGYYAGEETK